MFKHEKNPLSEEQLRARKIMAGIGAGVVVLACVIGLVIGIALQSPTPTDDPATSPVAEEPREPAPTTPPAAPGSVVDSSVTKQGWVPEPITTSVEEYGVAAALAGTTYDTTLATHQQFLDYLATWHTEDYEIIDATDRTDSRKSKLSELQRRIIVSSTEWDQQALKKTVVTSEQEGTVKIDYDHIEIAADALERWTAAGFHDVTVDLVVIFTQQEPSTGDDLIYENRITVSMQLQCGNSMPVEGSGQRPDDCKLIRFYPEPLV